MSARALAEEMNALIGRERLREAVDLFDAWAQADGGAGGYRRAPTVLAYNFLLHARLRLGAPAAALLPVLAAMDAAGAPPNLLMEADPVAQPDADSYNLVVTLAANSRRPGAAMGALRRMVTRGLRPTRPDPTLAAAPLRAIARSAYNEVLFSCSRLRRTRDAAALLRELQAQDLVPAATSLGELALAAAEKGDADCALLALQLVSARRLMLDQGSLLVVLDCAARRANTALAEQAWAMALSDAAALESDLVLAPSGAAAPAAADDAAAAAAASAALHPALHLARIQAYAAHKDLKSAFRAVCELEAAGAAGSPPPDSALSPAEGLRELTLACSRSLQQLDDVSTLHSSLDRSSSVLSLAFYHLVDMQAAGEEVALACINCVVAGCSALRDMDRAVQTFDEIGQLFQLIPNVHSYTALVDGYGRVKQAGEALKMFQAIKANGLEPDLHSHMALINAYLMSHDSAGATDAVQSMIVFESISTACHNNQQLLLVNEQVDAGHTPPRDLLIRLLRRCQHTGDTAGAGVALQLLRQFLYRPPHIVEVRRRELLQELVKGRQQLRGGDTPRAVRQYERPMAAGHKPTMAL
eukprot:SM000044S16003  [mRNA]  locus=s44:535091:538328:+ [translate_table: standard]